MPTRHCKLLPAVLSICLHWNCFANQEEMRGIGDIMAAARQGKTLTVVFFGGSLTWGASASDPNLTSWRGQTMKMLREKYPRVPWTFYDAAIGGTGSSLGVFRLERDVFSRKPDLVFLDFTLNDGLEGTAKGIHDQNNQSYETIIRECLSRRIAVMPIFLTARKYTEMKDMSQWKRRTQHLELFHHYQLEYADVLGLMNRKFLDGKLDTEALWPTELFDMTHPRDLGYAEYFRNFEQEWNRIEKSPVRHPVMSAEPVSGKSFTHVARIEAVDLNLPGWKSRLPFLVSDNFDWMTSRWVDKVAITSNADQTGYYEYKLNGKKLQTLDLTFRGEMIALLLEAMPKSVPLAVSIDGGKPRLMKSRPVKSSRFEFWILATGLNPETQHRLSIIPQEPKSGEVGFVRLGSILISGSRHAAIIGNNRKTEDGYRK